MIVEFAARSHVGLVRPRNEDAWGAWPQERVGSVEADALVFAVADGMGGHPGGDVASALAVGAVRAPIDAVRVSPSTHLRALFADAHDRIGREATRDPSLLQMGTTLTAALLRDGCAWIGQIGDTRLYWIRGRSVQLVTRDHTLAQDLVDSGALNAREAEDHYASHVLTRCLGVCPDHAPDLLLRPLRLRAGDRLLLTSDGLVKAIPTEELPRYLAEGSVEETAARLEAASLAAGAPDNVTVVLLEVVDPGEPIAAQPVEFGEPATVLWTRD